MFRKILRLATVAVTALTLAVAPIASYSVSMQQMFNTMSNNTPAGAYRGQTQNFYTGGDLSVRTPQKNYQMFSFAPPSFSGGCGGINMFGGSFSFINAQQFVSMLQNIGSAALSQAFFMAIDAMSPMVGVNLKQLMDKLQKQTNQNINSCEKGKELANNLFGNTADKMKAVATEHALDFSRLNNLFADASDAVDKVAGSDTQIAAQNNAAAAAGQVVYGNLVWNALAQQNKFAAGDNLVSEFEARLIMSLVGTIIIKNSSADAAAGKSPVSVKVIPPMLTAQHLDDFIGLDGTATLSGFQIYTCFDGGAGMVDTATPSTDPNPLRTDNNSLQCTSVGEADVAAAGGQNFQSMLTMVTNRMNSIQTALLNDTPVSASDKDFINATSVPVYKMLSVSTAYAGSGLSQSMIQGNAKVIAAEYANAYINNLLDILNRAIAKYADRAGPGYADQIKSIVGGVAELRKVLNADLSKAYQGRTNMNSLAQEIMGMEKMMMANMPNSLSSAISMRRLKGM